MDYGYKMSECLVSVFTFMTVLTERASSQQLANTTNLKLWPVIKKGSDLQKCNDTDRTELKIHHNTGTRVPTSDGCSNTFKIFGDIGKYSLMAPKSLKVYG